MGGMANGPRTLRLSVLDQSPIPEGGSGQQALRNSLELARLAESLGYGRYWVAEHHGTPMLACAAPEIMVGAIAAVTDRIRVGSGGVMLTHYSPFKVAEVFSVLAGLYGERIDLGIGRAPGGDLESIYALQRDRRTLLPEDYSEQIAELLAYFEDGFPPGHPLARLAQLPGAPGTAVIWLLGTSPESGAWAAELGLPYSVADFINPGSAGSSALYRELFTPSRRSGRPEVSVAVGAVCAETDEEAERLASSWKMAINLAGGGQFGPLPAVQRALAFVGAERSANGFAGRRVVVGSPATVGPELESIADEYGADELMVHTLTHDHEARCRSYELIAQAFGISPDSAAEPEPLRRRG
jgi:luciferase family oxidoreductase group 1